MIPNPFLPLAIGLSAIVLVLSGLLYLYSNKLDLCNRQRAALQQQVATLEDKLDIQNKAVDDLKEKSLKAQERAKAAISEARKRSETLGRERDRLKAAKPTGGSPCPAGAAVQKIRDGLK